jgi:hypothetical protein
MFGHANSPSSCGAAEIEDRHPQNKASPEKTLSPVGDLPVPAPGVNRITVEELAVIAPFHTPNVAARRHLLRPVALGLAASTRRPLEMVLVT